MVDDANAKQASATPDGLSDEATPDAKGHAKKRRKEKTGDDGARPKPTVRVRRWKANDIPGLVACHRAAYPEYLAEDEHYDERNYRFQLTAFPEGQFLAELNGKVIGYATSIIVQLDDSHVYTYAEITGEGAFTSHNPSGDTLYGADIAVDPAYRGMGVAKKLYKQRRKLMKRYNLRRMVAYGRIPGYTKVAGKMSAEEYVDHVVKGDFTDPSLNAHLKAGYRVKRVMLDILEDGPSLNYCTFLEMINPDFKPMRRTIETAPLRRPVRKVRVCLAQYMMRPVASWDDVEESVAFFVNTADRYASHFLVLPELFTAQMFSTMPAEWETRRSVMELAAMADRYRATLRTLAMRSRIYIVGGTHPTLRDGRVYNTAHLFTPSGSIYTQDQLHLPVEERREWGMRPGHEMHLYETPLGRIAIQVSYDIQFPELTRLYALSGAEIVFVPFSTDERVDYHRVRTTAQARAIENSVYVAMTGTVGNLPNRSYVLNYGQAAVFTPSDFFFPPNATAGEADPNVETVVITDLDLGSLVQHRELGDTRPMQDRRPDLYELASATPVRIVHAE